MTTRPSFAFRSPLFLGFVLVLVMAVVPDLDAQTCTVLHSFTGGPDGGVPEAGLTMDRSGNLYGTTFVGGAGYGVVFKLAHGNAGWVSTSIYTFRGSGSGDGAGPSARVVFGLDGALYGTTTAGGVGSCTDGQSGCGTVFRLTPPATVCRTALCPWDETILYRFTGGSDGGVPYASVVFDQAGNLYGTTSQGANGGVVYELSRSGSGWVETVLYSFSGQSDGGIAPHAEVTFGPLGNIYGTTYGGGSYGYGTVYQLVHSASGWTGSTIYSIPDMDGFGDEVLAGVIFDHAGNLYGGTGGNVFAGCGRLFEVSPSGSGWNGQVLYEFPCVTGYGVGPFASFLLTSDGNLLGTTTGDGNDDCNAGYGCGTVFEAVHGADGSWNNVNLYEFNAGSGGIFPLSNVTVDSAGNLYGTASASGLTQNGCGGDGCGVVWELTP
jgi:hypothetical protein